MRHSAANTVSELSEYLSVTSSTVYRWINEGKLQAEKHDGILHIPIDQPNSSFIVKKIREKYSSPRLQVPKNIRGYHKWHTILDEICWLIKVTYSSRENVKRKRFRLDKILQNYLTIHEISLSKTKRIFQSGHTADIGDVSEDLRRAWYNELSYSLPLKTSTLGLSFSDISVNELSTIDRFTFPSWRIIKAYYSVYFFIRMLAQIQVPAFDLSRHNATLSVFTNNLLSPISKALWKFPFDIYYEPNRRVYRRNLFVHEINHLQYKYSSHPRVPYRSPLELFEHIYSTFRKNGRRGKSPSPYTILHFLRDFRVWANYIDINNMLNLWGPGYRSFLDQNLSTVMFLVSAISEICFMSVYSPAYYVKELQDFYDLIIESNKDLNTKFSEAPHYQRFQIYAHFGFVTDFFELQEPPNRNALVLKDINSSA